ncbi:MAG TPA: BatA domain-containing protein, partial [Rhizomicrobium sp.]|nr:BatA domain-containing protein [Rhizomicrobium sp.]
MNLFSNLTFGTPWILAALAALPVIWWLLRVTPPSPRRVVFPPLRLLQGLTNREETPARTPPWLLLLRLFAAALVIVALAEPEWGGQKSVASNGPLVLFVDNGWTAAQNWNARRAAISDALETAARAGRAVAILPTASPRPDATLLSAGAAERQAGGLDPAPWLPDRRRAVAALRQMKSFGTPEILWLSDGIDYGDSAEIERALTGIGRLHVFADPPGKAPLVLRSLDNETDGFVAHVARPAGIGAQEGDVAALGAQGEMLATAHFRFAPDARD